MLLNLRLPRINALMTTARLVTVHVGEGAAISVGDKLLDLAVDLSAAAPHDCPPISYFRLIVRDKVWLRRLDAVAGDEPEVGASLALFTTHPDEPIAGSPAREVRLTTVSIVPPTIWEEDRW